MLKWPGKSFWGRLALTDVPKGSDFSWFLSEPAVQYFYFKDPEVSQVASAKVAGILASSHKGHSKEQRNDKD